MSIISTDLVVGSTLLTIIILVIAESALLVYIIVCCNTIFHELCKADSFGFWSLNLLFSNNLPITIRYFFDLH